MLPLAETATCIVPRSTTAERVSPSSDAACRACHWTTKPATAATMMVPKITVSIVRLIVSSCPFCAPSRVAEPKTGLLHPDHLVPFRKAVEHLSDPLVTHA
jgi:hypothetical protein